MAQNWRLRRCPGCAEVQAAGDLEFADRPGAQPWQGGNVMRRCPLCGFMGETGEFEVVVPLHTTEKARRQAAYFAMLKRYNRPFNMQEYRRNVLSEEPLVCTCE